MMTVMIRRVTPLLVCLVLVSCNSLPMLKMKGMYTSDETLLFAQGLDQYIESRDLTTLKLMPLQYPQGEWRTRAEGIIAIAEQQQQQQDRLKKNTRELAHSQQKIGFLFEDKKILEVTLERLKQVLIDMESRAE